VQPYLNHPNAVQMPLIFVSGDLRVYRSDSTRIYPNEERKHCFWHRVPGRVDFAAKRKVRELQSLKWGKVFNFNNELKTYSHKWFSCYFEQQARRMRR